MKRLPKLVTDLPEAEKAARYDELAERVKALGAVPDQYPAGAMQWVSDVTSAAFDVLTRRPRRKAGAGEGRG